MWYTYCIRQNALCRKTGITMKHTQVKKGFFPALRRILFRVLCVVCALTVTLAFAAFFCLISDEVCANNARTLPPYARENILPVLEKQTWTEEDYDFLYRQTGLGRAPLDSLKGQTRRILAFQDALFYDAELACSWTTPTTPHEYTVNYIAPLAPIEDGDIFITSSCHTYGWQHGHAAIVTDAEHGRLLQSLALGLLSAEQSPDWFRQSANFLVLRLKGVSAEERAAIAQHAQEHYVGVPYDVFTGIFSPRDQGDDLVSTNCCHLVWQAFYAFGYDLDTDGGLICSCRDIAASPLLEVVQVYGFDPLTLWN